MIIASLLYSRICAVSFFESLVLTASGTVTGAIFVVCVIITSRFECHICSFSAVDYLSHVSLN